MLRFACPQCGKQYSVGEDLAGRRGWCVSCMAPVAVPFQDGSEPKPLTLEQQVETLRGLLQAAEERYRRHEERFKQADRLARALYQRYKTLRDDFDARAKRLQDEAARVEEARAQVKELTYRLSKVSEARGRAEARLVQALESAGQVREGLEREGEGRPVIELPYPEMRPFDEAAGEAERSLQAETERLGRELAAERTARGDAERAREAGEVWAAGLEAQLRQLQEELDRTRRRAERGQSMEVEAASLRGRAEQLERELAALRTAYAESVASQGVAEGRAEQVVADCARLSAELEAAQAGTVELEMRLRESERRIAQAGALEHDRLEARRLLAESEAQVERLTSRLATEPRDLSGAESSRAQEELANERALRQEAETRLNEAVREAEGLRGELRAERSARLEADKLLRQQELQASEALRAVERLQADSGRYQAEAEALGQARVRAERLEAELEAAREALAEAWCGAESAADMAERLRVLESQAEKWQGTVDRLAAEVSSATEASGALNARLGELSRELDRREEALARERASRNAYEERARAADERRQEAEAQARDAEERYRDASRRKQEAEDRLEEALRRLPTLEEEDGPEPASTAPANGSEAEFTFIPEILEGTAEEEDAMIETLLRFIEEPKQEGS